MLRGKTACDRRTIWCLYFSGIQRKIYKYNKKISEREKKMRGRKKNKRSVLVAESSKNSQNTQFGLVIQNGAA